MGNEWTIDLPKFGLIRISPELISTLRSFRQLSDRAPESGGVLIGKYLNSNGVILIDDYTPPQATDIQKRCLYFRSEAHNRLVQKIWEESNHYSTYVGLWHTHPEPIPKYSYVDKKDWNNALNKSVYEGNQLFFFIVGQSCIRCWMGTKNGFKNNITLIGEYRFGK